MSAANATNATNGKAGQGRHAVVTGASRGIGERIAHSLAEDGWRLTVMGRDEQALRGLVERLERLGPIQAAQSGRVGQEGQASQAGQRHAMAVIDVGDSASVEAAFAAARQQAGPIAALVNNAGQADSAPFTRMSLELWQRMLSVNLTGSFLCSQQAVADMLQAGWGRIVNVASTAGLKGYAYVSAYAAAKHGVIGLTRSLALEFARKGITVNAVCPGYTETGLLARSIANVVATTGRSEEAAKASFAAGNPQGRLVQPDEVAEVVRWLCSPATDSITGQSIAVAGGEVM